MKFGGSALATPASMRRAVQIIRNEKQRWPNLVVVVAALEGVTDQLLSVAKLAAKREQRAYHRIIGEIRERHQAVVDELLADSMERRAMSALMDRHLFSLLRDCQVSEQRPAALARWSDRIVAIGEQMVATVFAALLRQEGLSAVALDASQFLVTDAVFGNARPIWRETAARVEDQLTPLLASGQLPVITGYIGSTLSGEITTLGRGGSDFTASILGCCLAAKEVWLWSSVAGLMSADPAIISGARVIENISYADAAELAYFGARVLHLKMIAPLERARIPLRVRSINQPEAKGTLIHDAGVVSEDAFLGVTSLSGLAIWPGDAERQGTRELLQALGRVGSSSLGEVDLMLTSQSSSGRLWCLSAPANTSASAADELLRLGEALNPVERKKAGDVWNWKEVSVITVVGGQLVVPEQSGRLLSCLAGFHLLGWSRGAHPRAVSLVVPMEEEQLVLARIHQLLGPSA